MRVQRKLLTEEQKTKICTKQKNNYCDNCPLRLGANCYDDIERLQKEIDDYWNEEIEVNI